MRSRRGAQKNPVGSELPKTSIDQIFDEFESQDESQGVDGPSETDETATYAGKATLQTGLCFYCCEPLIADQPGGRSVQHVDGRPYDSKCRRNKR